MDEPQIVVVGAGPTGLVLALFLAKVGVKARIIDKNSGPGQASRAMAVQARTLEFYRQLGFGDEVVEKGIEIKAILIREHEKLVARVDVKDMGGDLSPYPFVLSFPQDEHEKLLVEHLKAEGVDVEWNTELVSFQDTGDAVRLTLRNADGAQEDATAAYLCGCDGARSVVREQLRLGFGGGTYEKLHFVADVEATGDATADGTFNFCLDAHDFMLVMPVRSSGMNRLIGVVPDELKDRKEITFEDVRAHAEKMGGLRVEKVNWFSSYRVHHRVADHFRVGRLFLSGDAGHIHSPVGGQGMNTGIGDAVNLSWKLAAVVQGRADASVLDTYEPERIAFAHSLVATTDKVFQAMTGHGLGSQIFREQLFPHLMPFALGFPPVRTAAFRLVSQIRINYHESALSDGAVGEIHGGDRLPWAQLDDGNDNFVPLQTVDWQAHVYGRAGDALRAATADTKLALHEFDWTDDLQKTGLKRDALYLVRPDGYVALADSDQDAARLTAYLSKFKIATRDFAAS